MYLLPMSPTLTKSSEIQHFECSNAIEICNGIAFVFYQRLLHILISRIDVVLPMCPVADAPGNESGPEGELPVYCWAMGGGHCSLGRL